MKTMTISSFWVIALEQNAILFGRNLDLTDKSGVMLACLDASRNKLLTRESKFKRGSAVQPITISKLILSVALSCEP